MDESAIVRRRICVRARADQTAHFWHFMMGEFFPVLAQVRVFEASDAQPLDLFILSDRPWGGCPLDRFYTDINGSDLQVHLVNEAPEGVTLEPQRMKWDRQRRPPRRRLLMRVVRSKPLPVELVLTGRGASRRLIAAADYVTEFRKRKHPYEKGLRARKGIEY